MYVFYHFALCNWVNHCCVATVSHADVITLPLFIEGVPKGGGSIYTARDLCFVIASMGINEKRAARLFFTVCPLRWHPIDLIAVASQAPPKRCYLRLCYVRLFTQKGNKKESRSSLFTFFALWGNSHWLNCSCLASAPHTVPPYGTSRDLWLCD